MAISFTGAHVPQDILLMGVRWSVAYPLSTRHVEARMRARGVHVDHATINRWVITYVELMHMIKKRPLVVEVGDEGLTAAEQFSALAASSPHRRWLLTPHRLHIRNCDQSVPDRRRVETPPTPSRCTHGLAPAERLSAYAASHHL